MFHNFTTNRPKRVTGHFVRDHNYSVYFTHNKRLKESSTFLKSAYNVHNISGPQIRIHTSKRGKIKLDKSRL